MSCVHCKRAESGAYTAPLCTSSSCTDVCSKVQMHVRNGMHERRYSLEALRVCVGVGASLLPHMCARVFAGRIPAFPQARTHVCFRDYVATHPCALVLICSHLVRLSVFACMCLCFATSACACMLARICSCVRNYLHAPKSCRVLTNLFCLCVCLFQMLRKMSLDLADLI